MFGVSDVPEGIGEVKTESEAPPVTHPSYYKRLSPTSPKAFLQKQKMERAMSQHRSEELAEVLARRLQILEDIERKEEEEKALRKPPEPQIAGRKRTLSSQMGCPNTPAQGKLSPFGTLTAKSKASLHEPPAHSEDDKKAVHWSRVEEHEGQ